jgi:hypothetical protein|uniref:Uncharacterized protein n=1 Tax=Eutreptiella gymnastica TaxID=73025 RepID=A0A7S4CUP2_9EUGL
MHPSFQDTSFFHPTPQSSTMLYNTTQCLLRKGHVTGFLLTHTYQAFALTPPFQLLCYHCLISLGGKLAKQACTQQPQHPKSFGPVCTIAGKILLTYCCHCALLQGRWKKGLHDSKQSA